MSNSANTLPLNKTDVRIRRAQVQDADAITQLLYQVHQVHADGRPDIFKTGKKKYTQEELLQIMQNDQTPIFVAVNATDQVMAYAFCVYQETAGAESLTDRKVLYVDDLCVDTAYRGQNIGTLLYQFVEEQAKASGCHSVTLQVWQLNAPAIRFYEKIGFQPLKTMLERVL